MVKVKAVAAGRWRIAPRTSIDGEAGHKYDVTVDVAEYLVMHGAAEYAGPDVRETKPFTAYEKQSSAENMSVPRFETKEQAMEWAEQNGIEIDGRKSLQKIQAALDEAVS